MNILTKQEIIARKNAMKASGKNIDIDASWGPHLEKMWQAFAPGVYLTSEIQEEKQKKDNDRNLVILTPQQTNNAKWYNPLTWGGGIAFAITNGMGREEREEYLKNHPYLQRWYNDNELYAQGKGLASGAETIGKVAIASYLPKAVRSVPQMKSKIPISKIPTAIKSVVSTAKANPVKWAGKQIANWFVLPLIGGTTVNKATEYITDKLLDSKRSWDDLASGALEFLGPFTNPGYLLNLGSSIKVKSKDYDKISQAIDYVKKKNNINNEISKINESIDRNVQEIPIWKINRKQKYVSPEYNGKATFTDTNIPHVVLHESAAISPDGISTTSFVLPGVRTGAKGTISPDGITYKSNGGYNIPIINKSFLEITNAYKKIADKIEKIVEDNAILTGKTKLYSEGYLPGDFNGRDFVPYKEIDLITTQSRLDALKQKIGFKKSEIKDLAEHILYGNSMGNTPTHITTILEEDGKATGFVAHRLYSILHPEEYAAFRNKQAAEMWEYSKRHNLGINENDNYVYNRLLPISAEELYNQFRKSGKNINKVLGDILSDKKPFTGEPIIYNPKILEQTQNAIQSRLNEIFGNSYVPPHKLYYNYDFNNIQSNSLLLQHVLNITKEEADKLAKNKLYVRDIFDQYINQITISFRRANGIKQNATNHTVQKSSIDDLLLNNTANFGGGSDHGIGGNSVRVYNTNADGLYYGNYLITTQQRLTFDPSKIKTFNDIQKQIKHLIETDSPIYHRLDKRYGDMTIFDKYKDHIDETMDAIGKEAVKNDLPFWIKQEIPSTTDTFAGYLGQLDRSPNKPHGYVFASRDHPSINIPGAFVMNDIMNRTPIPITDVAQVESQRFYTMLNNLIQKEHYPTENNLTRTNGSTTFNFNFSDISEQARQYMMNRDALNILASRIGNKELTEIFEKNIQKAFKHNLINKEQLNTLREKGIQYFIDHNTEKSISDGIIRDIRNLIIKNNKKFKQTKLLKNRNRNLEQQSKNMGTIPIYRNKWRNNDESFNLQQMQLDLYTTKPTPSILPIIPNGLITIKGED